MADAAHIMDRLAEIRSERRPAGAEEVDSGDALASGDAFESTSADEAAIDVGATNDVGPADEPLEEEKSPSRPVRVGDRRAPTSKAEADRRAPARNSATNEPSRTAGPARKAGTSAEAKAGSLRGRVVDARTGRAVAGARVRTAAGPAVVSNRAGVFQISGLAAKSHRLRITAKGFVAVERVVVVSRARPAALTVRLRPAGAANSAAVRAPR
jgi:hypothetical protein